MINKQVEDILNAASSNGRFTGEMEIAYQLGVLAGWLARLSKDDWYIQQEVIGRLEQHKQSLESANGLENILTGLE